MKKFTKSLLAVLAVLPLTVLGQTVYTFDTGGNGYSSDGTTYTNLIPFGNTTTSQFEIKTLAALSATAGGDANTTNVFHGISRTDNIQSVDLTAISSCTNQQVVWKTYLQLATTPSKGIGVILRAQGSASGYSASARQGYHFVCYGSGTSGTVKFRVGKLDGSSSYTSIKSETSQAIAGFTNGPLYLRAKVVGTSLSFEYSIDGSTYTAFPGSPYTDATYSSGLVQLAWGLGSGSGLNQYYDDVTYTNLDVPTVALNGNDKYVYDGSQHGPNSATPTFFSGTPTYTYAYKGIGATSYGPSSSQPSTVGTYAAYVNATYGSQSANDTLAYEILPNTYKYYTFNDDTKGVIAVNTYNHSTAASHLVQKGAGYMFGTNGVTGSKSTGNMLQSTGDAITTLATFGTSDSIGTDYQVIWKDYATTGQKRGIILRANGHNRFLSVGLTTKNTVNVGQGYMFYVANTGANTLQLDIRKLQSDTVTYKTPSILATNTTSTYLGVYTATWYRASVQGSNLKFEYSTDAGTNWTLVHNITDDGTTYGAVYTSGTTQISAIHSGGTSYYFDYLGYKDISTPTALNNISRGDNEISVFVNGTSVTVNASSFDVYSIQGVKVKTVNSTEASNTIVLQQGIYIVKSGASVKKIIVG